MDQLVDKGVISDSFSLCYGGMGEGGGAMVLGGMKSPHDMVFPHSNPSRSPYYNIELKKLHVAAYPLKLNPKVFDGGYGTVLDSGTTYAYLPKDAFLALKDSIMREMRFLKQIPGMSLSYTNSFHRLIWYSVIDRSYHCLQRTTCSRIQMLAALIA